MGVRRDGDGEGETGTPSFGGDSTHTEHPSRASGSRDGEQAHREGRPPPVAPPPAPPRPAPKPLALAAAARAFRPRPDRGRRHRPKEKEPYPDVFCDWLPAWRRCGASQEGTPLFFFFSLLTARYASTREALCAEQASEPP